ncbi:GPW/gp25 family protein [Thiocapsa sp. KS1]|nr:GPW/gp25 family protein [Thiocapsa sp. KS1]
MSAGAVSDRSSAWRFVHPDFDESAFNTGSGGTGIVVGSVGRIALIGGAAAVRQSILLLLSTVPGERLRRPQYGCELHRLVFSPNDETTHGLAMHYIAQALARWEPRVDLLEVDARRDPDAPHLMQVTLLYRVRHTQEDAQLAFTVDMHSSDH